jgi:molecular chaperone DnaK
LTEIPPAPRGVPQIEVTFDIDANGILHVSAKDLGTGKEQKITITASSGLTKDEIEKMRHDAESHADEDKAQRDAVEARNEADNAVYRSEKMIKDNADKISSAQKEAIEAAAKEVREALKGSDTVAIKTASEKLNDAWQAASADMYRAASESAKAKAGGAANPTPGGGRSSEEGPSQDGAAKEEGPIIDAEVVDEKK